MLRRAPCCAVARSSSRPLRSTFAASGMAACTTRASGPPPGAVALETMTARLSEDHRRAALLADLLTGIEGVTVGHAVETNIVMADLDGTLPAPELCRELGARQVGALPYDELRVRLVTHRHNTDAAIELVAATVADLLREGRLARRRKRNDHVGVADRLEGELEERPGSG